VALLFLPFPQVSSPQTKEINLSFGHCSIVPSVNIVLCSHVPVICLCLQTLCYKLVAPSCCRGSFRQGSGDAERYRHASVLHSFLPHSLTPSSS